jgi:large subunit ribosomal protein L24
LARNKTKSARKQRKRRSQSPDHRYHRFLTVRLDDKLIEKYKFVISRMPIRKGDKVKVIRGGFRAPTEEYEVAKVIVKNQTVVLEKAVVSKSDGKQVPRVFKPSNLVITKLNLSDRRRRERIERLGIELEIEAEEMAEEEEEEEEEDEDEEEEDEEEEGDEE